MHLVRLSDLLAPEWVLPVGEESWRMKPLSLKTFAEAEGRHIYLEDLQAGDQKAWLRFMAFLADRPEGEVQEVFVRYPLAVEALKRQVLWAFGQEEDPRYKVNRRQVKNPLKDKLGEEPTREPQDFGFLITLSRASGIALADLFRMTFRGLAALQRSLEEMPPAPRLL